VRPESVAIAERAPDVASADARATVVDRAFFGHDHVVHLQLPSGQRLRSRRLGAPAWGPGDEVRVWIDGPVSALAPTGD
jgi:hypothetical protein